MTDPERAEWRSAMDGCTSAQLRHAEAHVERLIDELIDTKKAFAASQRDLTDAIEARDTWHRVAERVTAQRDEARAEATEIRSQLLVAAEQRQFLHERLAEARRDLIRSENELGRVRFERDHARTWQVARNDDAGACVLCGQPIVRSQAFEPQVGAAAGSYSHVECPEVAS